MYHATLYGGEFIYKLESGEVAVVIIMFVVWTEFKIDIEASHEIFSRQLHTCNLPTCTVGVYKCLHKEKW